MPAIPEVKDATTYKPEYSWNYEVGTHLTLWEGKLWADLAAFYMDTRDQQLSQFIGSGLDVPQSMQAKATATVQKHPPRQPDQRTKSERKLRIYVRHLYRLYYK